MSERNSFLDTVVDRTLGNLRSLRTAWRDIAAQARDVLSGAPSADLSRDDAEHLREQFRECLAARGGAVSTLARAKGDGEQARIERDLRLALEPPRVKLLTHFNALPVGVKFLVDMRAELMALSTGDAVLAGLEGDLKSLLAGWFDVGFLKLARITWDAPAALLEKLIVYEA